MYYIMRAKNIAYYEQAHDHVLENLLFNHSNKHHPNFSHIEAAWICVTRLYLVWLISILVVPKNLNPAGWLSWLPTTRQQWTAASAVSLFSQFL